MRRVAAAFVCVLLEALACNIYAQSPEPMIAPMIIPEQIQAGELAHGEPIGPPLWDSLAGDGLQPYADPAPLLGFSTVRNARGEASFPDNLLPTPTDPNDIQVSDLLQTVNVRTYAPGGSYRAYGDSAEAGTAGQIGLQGRLGFFYDTGYAGGANAFRPAQIAVDGSPDAHRRGQLKFVDSSFTGFPLKLQLGTQTPSTPAGHMQSYVELLTTDEAEGIQARRAFLRTVDDSLTHSFLLGKDETLIGDAGAMPVFITPNSRPIGAIGIAKEGGGWDGIAQARYAYISQDWAYGGDQLEMAASVEDPSSLNDVPSPMGGAMLQRFPALGLRLRYQLANKFDSFQLGAIVRPLGVEDAAFVEHFETGWGVAGLGRFRLSPNALDSVYFSVVGGEGTGSYIWNGTTAAHFAADDLQTLSNFGTFAGYQRFWWVENANENLSSNFVVGYIDGTAPTADANRTLHQAAVNLLWNVSATTGWGVEYQYGRRELGSGASGDDHRIMFGVQFSPGKSAKGEAAAATARGSYDLDSLTPTRPAGEDKSRLRL